MSISPFGGDFMFTLIPIIIGIIFVIVIAAIVVMAVRGGIQWNKNNNSPVLTVNAKIVTKRMAVDSHHHQNGSDGSMSYTSSSTTYFATFEVESGDRIELRVPNNEYGMLAEGDAGRLTFQGTRYKGFSRGL